jgi:predicted phosphodiesterase
MTTKKKQLAGEITQNYLMRFPNTSKLALARKLNKDNPLIFTSVDNARSIIKYYTESNGKSLINKQTTKFNESLKLLKAQLPKGESEKKEIYYLPKDRRRILMLSDIHIPYQCDEALFTAIEFGIEKDVDTIWLNGDTMDMYQLSRFNKDPRNRNFKYELDCTRTFLQGLRNIFPKAQILFKIGNHEVRWENFLRLKAAELLDLEEFRLSELLYFTKLGITLIEDKQLAYCGQLPVMHFHELPLKSGGVNPARAVFLKTGHSVIGGHYHRKSEHVERTLDSKLIKVYSTGCLCDLYASYMPFNNWSHGFAYIEVDNEGSYVVYNKTIMDGKIY